jgi:hypothetical protein
VQDGNGVVQIGEPVDPREAVRDPAEQGLEAVPGPLRLRPERPERLAPERDVLPLFWRGSSQPPRTESRTTSGITPRISRTETHFGRSAQNNTRRTAHSATSATMILTSVRRFIESEPSHSGVLRTAGCAVYLLTVPG